MPLNTQWEKRVQTFHYIYQTLISESNPKQIIKSAFEEFNFDANQMKVIEYYANNINSIKNKISSLLTNNWTWERIPYTTKAILISAYSESKIGNIDKKIIIDQALITASKYCEANEKKFINAILDKII